ncbi:MAG: 1-phosphofructokinase family hexose kinase [Deinococcota bacterium]
MIVTLTLNPALDMRMMMVGPKLGELNRAREVSFEASGKGLNVSRALAKLGHASTAIAPLGGAFGQMIADELQQGVAHHASEQGGGEAFRLERIPTPHNTRCNTKIIDQNGVLSEFNASGAPLTEDVWQACQACLEAALQNTSTTNPKYLVLSGSLPPGLPANTYATLVTTWQARGVRVIVDASGEALTAAFEAQPWLLKPNEDEIYTLLGKRVTSLEQAASAARDLQSHGIPQVIVTLGKLGAAFALGDSCVIVPAPEIKAVTPVGAGDTLLAAVLVGLCESQDVSTLARYAMAAAAVRVSRSVYPTPAMIDDTIKMVNGTQVI